MVLAIPQQPTTLAKVYLTNNDVSIVPYPPNFLKCKMFINVHTDEEFVSLLHSRHCIQHFLCIIPSWLSQRFSDLGLMINPSTHLRTGEVLSKIWKSWTIWAHVFTKTLVSKHHCPTECSVMKKMFYMLSTMAATSHMLLWSIGNVVSDRGWH